MIIENVIDKGKMSSSLKLIVKYNMITAIKVLAFFSIGGLIFIILNFFPIFRNPENSITKMIIKNIIYFIILLFCNLYLYFILRKQYKHLSKESEKLFMDNKFVGRKYVFNERSLNVEMQNISNNKILKFDFNKYYKIWILNKTNTVVIQFNKELYEKTFVVIYDVSLSEFKNYCAYYNLNYKIVRQFFNKR